MSARILFVQPHYHYHMVHPPLGMSYIAGYLRRSGHEVGLLDLNVNRLAPDQVVDRIRRFSPDVVGSTAVCTGVDSVRDTVRLSRKAVDAPVVVGGAQASALPEHTLGYTGADYVVTGEGEQTMLELVEALGSHADVGAIRGLGYASGGSFSLNPARRLIKDIDSIPFPAWDLTPPRRYRIAPILSSARKFPIAPVISSRGCPFDCTFCAGKITWGKSYRYRSAESVVDEMELLLNEYGVKEIFVSDDNFNLNASHAFEVCETILERGLKFDWACPNGLRVDSITPQLLSLMKRAGCHLVGLGIESGNQEILDRAKKRLDLGTVPGVCRQIEEAGIKAVGFFLIGLPGETRETAVQTIEFARSLPLRRAWFSLVAPLPGSEIFEEYTRGRDLDSLEWEKLTTAGDDVAQLSVLTPAELDSLQREAARRFYARPRILFDLAVSQRPSTIAAFLRSEFFRKRARAVGSSVAGLFRGSEGRSE